MEIFIISEASCERLYLLMFSKRLFNLEPSEFDHISILSPYSSGSYNPIQSSEKTLNEADLEQINNLIIKTVENKTGAKIRS